MERLKNEIITEEIQQKQIDFLKENNIHVVGYHMATDFDYQVFTDCLAIYQATGINHFERYKAFYQDIQQLQLEEGIKGFYKSQKGKVEGEWNSLESFEQAIKKRIEEMYFFGLDEINEHTEADYLKLLEEAKTLPMIEEEGPSESDLDQDERRVADYFNFADFDRQELEKQFQMCIQTLEGKKYQAEALMDWEKGHYLVVGYDEDTPLKIGSATNLKAWLKENQTGHLTTYGVFKADEDYLKELKVKVCLHYPTIQAYSGMVQASNKMYANLKQAKRVYSYLNGLNLAHLKQIIEINQLKQHFIGGASVVDKAELDKQIRRFLNLEVKD